MVSPLVRLFSAGGGDQEIHVKEGSSVKLKCVVTNILEPPQYVTWYLNDKVNDFLHICFNLILSRLVGLADGCEPPNVLVCLTLYYITRYQSEDQFTYTANYTQKGILVTNCKMENRKREVEVDLLQLLFIVVADRQSNKGIISSDQTTLTISKSNRISYNSHYQKSKRPFPTKSIKISYLNPNTLLLLLSILLQWY